MGQSNQERFDLFAGKVRSQRQNTLQNSPAFNQTAGAEPTLRIVLLVQKYLLTILKLPDFFFPPFLFGLNPS